MKKLLALALVFTLGACSSSSEHRETASEGSYHYVPVGVDG